MQDQENQNQDIRQLIDTISEQQQQQIKLMRKQYRVLNRNMLWIILLMLALTIKVFWGFEIYISRCWRRIQTRFKQWCHDPS